MREQNLDLLKARCESDGAGLSGCSTGGQDALMEAIRYPLDFDGIGAGVPVGNFIFANPRNRRRSELPRRRRGASMKL